MAKDPRMSALDKVEGMVKGIGRAVGGGGMAGGMKPKPNPYGKAKRLTDRTMKKAGDKIAGRNTWQRAKTLAGDAGRAAGARASGASLEREPLTKAGSVAQRMDATARGALGKVSGTRPMRQTPAMKARGAMKGAGRAVGNVGRAVR